MAHNLDLDEVHAAIVSSIQTAFPTYQTVEAYREERNRLSVPAVLIELEDMEHNPDGDGGGGQLPVVGKWVARIVINERGQGAKQTIRKMAGALAAHVHTNRWGVRVGPASVTVAAPDHFSPEFDRYEVWAIEWDQPMDLGPNLWRGEGVTPDQILIGLSPEVGQGNEEEYRELPE